MDADSFLNLALRVLAGEAGKEDRHALETELSRARASDPARLMQFEQLKMTQQMLRTVAPMTGAIRATEPELPPWRLPELRAAVRQHLREAGKQRASSGLTPVLRRLFLVTGAP